MNLKEQRAVRTREEIDATRAFPIGVSPAVANEEIGVAVIVDIAKPADAASKVAIVLPKVGLKLNHFIGDRPCPHASRPTRHHLKTIVL